MTWGSASHDNLVCAVAENYTLPTNSSLRPNLPHNILPSNTANADTGNSGIYLTPQAPCANINPSVQSIVVGTAGGPPHCSSASWDIQTHLLVSAGHIMPQFHQNIVGISELCDHDFRILFEKNAVTFFSQDDTLLLKG